MGHTIHHVHILSRLSFLDHILTFHKTPRTSEILAACVHLCTLHWYFHLQLGNIMRFPRNKLFRFYKLPDRLRPPMQNVENVANTEILHQKLGNKQAPKYNMLQMSSRQILLSLQYILIPVHHSDYCSFPPKFRYSGTYVSLILFSTTVGKGFEPHNGPHLELADYSIYNMPYGNGT